MAAWLGASSAAADAPAAVRETARGLMAEGDRLLAAGDLQGAMAQYQSAHALMHVPTTGLQLARVQARLGLLVEARNLAMEVINLPVDGKEPKVFGEARHAAEALSAELEPRVPAVKTSVLPADADYRLNIDGVSLPTEARGVPYRTNPGKHVVRIDAEGFTSKTVSVELIEGQTHNLSVQLERAAAIAPAAAAQAQPSPDGQRALVKVDDDPAAAGRLRGIVGLSAGGVVLIVGTVTGIMAASQYSHEKENCPGNVCDPSRRGELSRANTLANIANVCIPLGALGVGYGLFELLTLPSAESAEAKQHALQLTITGAGATLRGTL